MVVCPAKTRYLPLVRAGNGRDVRPPPRIVNDNVWLAVAVTLVSYKRPTPTGRDAPPSQLALATSVIEFGRRASTSTASECPSSAATNGLANMRSIFAAFNARMRSRPREKGCCKGSRFLRVGVGSPGLAGRWAEGACCRTEIFCTGIRQVMRK